MGQTPSIASVAAQAQDAQSLKLWAVGGDGIVRDADFTPPSTFTWHDRHKEADTPSIVLSNNAVGPGGCQQGDILGVGESIFPQWAPVMTPDTKPRIDPDGSKRPCQVDAPAGSPDACPLDTDRNRALLYPNGNMNLGFNAEKPRAFSGVVARSHIAALDTPFNHTRRPAGSIPLVAHDWNIIIAPDVAYQHMLSEANLIDENGMLEVEWEQQDLAGLGIFDLPGVGDRVAVRGRWIYDCGHPPFKTEIHPPTAMVTIKDNTARLLFQPIGGQTWFQPSDPLLPGPFPKAGACPLATRLGRSFADFGLGDAIDLYLTVGDTKCNRHIPLDRVEPDDVCYFPYNHTMRDILHDDVPLVFDLLLPKHPTEAAPSDAFLEANARLGTSPALDSPVTVTMFKKPPP
jgi:hypothetical protein